VASFKGGTPISLNGTTWVSIVAAPATGQKQILACHVHNLDTVQHTIKHRLFIGAAGYEDFAEQVLAPGQKAQIVAACIVLDATNMSYELSMAAAASVTQPRARGNVFEVP